MQMKKNRLFLIILSVVALLAIALVSFFVVNNIRANRTWQVNGEITGITTGTVQQIDKDLWQVDSRQISGIFSGKIAGNFTITYSGQFSLSTQAGEYEGTLNMDDGSLAMEIQGTTEPMEMVAYQTAGGLISLPRLSLNGTWKSVPNQKGTIKLKSSGTYSAWLIFTPTADGHVDKIVDSSITLLGKGE
jgi:hypothetical protein